MEPPEGERREGGANVPWPLGGERRVVSESRWLGIRSRGTRGHGGGFGKGRGGLE